MAVKWTEEQQRVIDTRNHNILVSAAAGSGKTAVLVERILAMVTDRKHPVDIDRLLVVTFTNAAAAEMRERIRDALEQRAENEPDNIHLQRQLVLVHNAEITTIHSFCLHVLRSHFQSAGIDPSFRVADEGEVMLMEQEAVKETVNEAYDTGGKEYENFLEAMAYGKSDAVIEELVLQLYHFALGQPWPQEWLAQCRSTYGEDGASGWGGQEHPRWLQFVEDDTGQLLADIREQVQEALRISQEPDGPYPYISALEDDLRILDQLQKGKDYDSYAEAFGTMGMYARLGTKKDGSISPQKKQQVQNIRNSVKDALAELRKRYYYDRIQILQTEFADSSTVVRVLTHLTERFMEILAEKKREKNILDFGDLEHLALKVLVTPAENTPTAAAREYAELFEEIMIDEYQDSNLVQEMILNSVSGRGCGEPNRFMVGDVKQSIYRFRLARPELFMEKYRTYRNGRECDCRIDLHKNFRSRAQVLDSINYIFRQIMTENPGQIVYDEDAALYPGAVFEPYPDGTDQTDSEINSKNTEGAASGRNLLPATELLLLETDGKQKIREEAELAGCRIREMVGRDMVWDKELAAYRPVKYGDIVILLRTVSGWAETFAEVLGDMGIPCFAGSQRGYFSAAEVRVVLSYLSILDNPIQDIPLAAVLRSAIGGFCDEELAQIRAASQEQYFYDCCREYERNGADSGLRRKLTDFFGVFEKLRGKCGHTPVHLLLWEILDVTGYGEYAASLPGGSQRKANLDMLVEKAIAYEATSYRGLYHFVRYIENLKKYDVDYGEANTGSESENIVRLMSIHKSKGLEFPVVFVCGMGKQFNESDIRSKVVLHPEYGVGCDYVDTKNRTRRATLLKQVIRQKTASENLGEELRVLYVAMTRAKEKLILTGSVRDATAKMEKWRAAAGHPGEQLSYSCLSGALTYLDWVMPALLRHPDARELLEVFDLDTESIRGGDIFPGTLARFRIQFAGEQEREQNRQAIRDESALRLQELLHLDPQVCRDAQTREYLERVFDSVYPFEEDNCIVGKLSVSELKKLSHVPEEDEGSELYQEETVIPLIPEFRSGETAIVGAARGTVYHTFMENLDFSKKDGLELQLEELISCGKMSQEESAVLKMQDIRGFLVTETGQEMTQAALKGQLFREQPFVIGVPANEIRPEWNGQETVLVQGIIDAYFYREDGSIVLLDYKTDRVQTVQTLVDKYHAQLEYYEAALRRLTGREVAKKVIYSFCLGKEILL